MAVLPRRAWRGRVVADPHGLQSASDDRPVGPVTITKKIARSLIPRECLGDLPRDPFRSWVGSDVGPHQAAPIQPYDDDDAIEKLEANGWHDEHVHGGDVWRVVVQKGAPSLAWRTASLDHVFGDRRLGDLEAELEKFAVDTRRSPQRVLTVHPPDQCAKVRRDLRPPSP